MRERVFAGGGEGGGVSFSVMQVAALLPEAVVRRAVAAAMAPLPPARSALKQGDHVRLTESRDLLEELCKAPIVDAGANRTFDPVGYNSAMDALVGQTVAVQRLSKDGLVVHCAPPGAAAAGARTYAVPVAALTAAALVDEVMQRVAAAQAAAGP